jgi:hypothetical protein
MLTDFIIRYENVFDIDECENIIEHINYLEKNSFLFYDDSSLHEQDQKSINLPNSYSLDLPVSSKISNLILPKFKPCVDNYLKKFSILNQSSFLIYDCKLKKIPPGSGFHSWHYENSSTTESSRLFVVQLYLNDDFDGGETEFLYQNKREQPKAGDVLIFPCGFTHVHRGNTPIGGTKYLVTTWGWIQPSSIT